MNNKALEEKIMDLELEVKKLKKELQDNRLIIKRREYGPAEYPFYFIDFHRKLNLLYEHLQLELAEMPSRTYVRSTVKKPERTTQKKTDK